METFATFGTFGSAYRTADTNRCNMEWFEDKVNRDQMYLRCANGSEGAVPDPREDPEFLKRQESRPKFFPVESSPLDDFGELIPDPQKIPENPPETENEEKEQETLKIRKVSFPQQLRQEQTLDTTRRRNKIFLGFLVLLWLGGLVYMLRSSEKKKN